MPLCSHCYRAVRQDFHTAEYFPMCFSCTAALKKGVEEGRLVSNEDGRKRPAECSVCRRACCFMRVGDGRPMCWECHGWWKRCSNDDAYVAASVKLFDRLDNMGLGHFMNPACRRLLTRQEREM